MAKWTTADIPDQRGRVAIVTGANSGLGLETAAALAGAGARVVLAVRDPGRGAAAAAAISARHSDANLAVRALDLADLGSVRQFAEALSAEYESIDVLVNNAGVMYPPRSTTADGFESQFGTNHLGHFALTARVMPLLLETDGSRVVTVSSVGHRIRADIHFDDLQWERRYDRVGAYGQSKLANLLFTYELDRRLRAADVPTIATAAHPGFSATELDRHLPRPIRGPVVRAISQSPAMGALPTLRAAVDPDTRGGDYFGPSGLFETRGYPKRVQSSARSRSRDLQSRLWEVSEELTGMQFPL